MPLEFNSLKSRVSKRIYLSFILSAIIPVSTIYLVSYNQISAQLDTEIRRQIYRESRSLGLAIYDRLLALETNLMIVANEIGRSGNFDAIQTDVDIKDFFNSMFIWSDGQATDSIFGAIYQEIYINSEQTMQLDIGNSILITVLSPDENYELYMLRSISSSNQEYLVAQLNRSYLWNLPVYSPEFACVMTSSNNPFYCSGVADINDFNVLLDSLESSSGDNYALLTLNGIDYLTHEWDIFLRARFFTQDFSLLFAVPQNRANFAIDDFTTTFPKILIITGLLVALLSIGQIRKTLSPLQKLTNGTRRIAASDYSTQVEVKTGDEFEVLAESFNDMARNIEQQFLTISVLADIDRLILSSLDKKYVIESLIKNVNKIIESGNVGIIILDDEDNYNATIFRNEDDTFRKVIKTEVKLTPSELKEVESSMDSITLTGLSERGYLKRLGVRSQDTAVVFPVHVKNKLIGMMCIVTSGKQVLSARELKEAREIADRIGVALSSALWEEKLYQQAHYDELTGLPNRFLFKDRMVQKILRVKQTGEKIALLYLDIDDFKVINDSFGHELGDELLQSFSEYLQTYSTRYESVGRLGGDEFLIFLSGDDGEENLMLQAESLANEIIRDMTKPFAINDQQIYISPSLGITVFPRDGLTYDDLLKNAEAAMYSVKAEGRNSYRFYNSEHNRKLTNKLKIQSELRSAMNRNELSLYYQPKINCSNGKVVGAEALLRWQHPVKGLIYPGDFINEAEESGLLINLGNWVLEQACRQRKIFMDEGIRDISIAVNISHEQFKSADIYDHVKNIIVKSGLRPSLLELEITESATIENFDRTIDIITRLKELGVVISIDDFGTGYSSLKYLQQIPVDKLKIDKSFIDKIGKDEHSSSIVSASVALAHSLNLKVVAEGVETQEQSEFLLELGCDEIQGFIITQPLTPENFRLFMLREGAINN